MSGEISIRKFSISVLLGEEKGQVCCAPSVCLGTNPMENNVCCANRIHLRTMARLELEEKNKKFTFEKN